MTASEPPLARSRLRLGRAALLTKEGNGLACSKFFPRRFIVVPGSPQHSSHFSPDGKWIAYVSAQTGRLEVFVRPFPAGTPAVQVSTSGGEHPQWSPDQKELFFDSSDRMYAVAISTDRTFTAATPAPLPIMGFIQGPLRRQYDLTPDGKHFLMMFPPAR